jgi:hypothetical protein
VGFQHSDGQIPHIPALTDADSLKAAKLVGFTIVTTLAAHAVEVMKRYGP